MTLVTTNDPPEQRAAATNTILDPVWPRPGLVVGGTSAVLMLVVGLVGLDRPSLWRDEAATHVAVHRSIQELWSMVRNVDAVHALYYAGLQVWMQFGSGETWMRLPSVLASATSAGTVAALGARLRSASVGLTAGVLFAAIPFVSFYAQEARSFALVSALVLVATYCLVRALETGGTWWPAYAALAAVAVVFNELAVLALVAHAVTLLLERAPWRIWWRWAICAGVGGMAVLPIVVVTSAQAGQVGWLHRPDVGTVGNVVQLFLGPNRVLIVLMAALVIVGLLVPASRSATPTGGSRPALASVAAPLLIVPPVVLIAASFVQPLFHPRYVLFAVAGVPLLAAAGVDYVAHRVGRGRQPWLPAVLAGALVLVVLVLEVPEQRATRGVRSRPEDLAAAAAAIEQNAQPGDAVLFMPRAYRFAALTYPRAFAQLRDVSLREGPIQAENLRGRDLSSAKTKQAMLTATRLWVVGRPELSVRATEDRALEQQAILSRYFMAERTIKVHGVDVALYTRSD